MTAVLLALLLIVVFFGLSQAARAQFLKFLLWAGIILVVMVVAVIAYLRDVNERKQVQQQAQKVQQQSDQAANRQQWVQGGPYIAIDHTSEIFANGAISVAFQQQCPDVPLIESDPYGVAYVVSFRHDYMGGLDGKQGNLRITHGGAVFYAGSGSLQTLAKKACSKITGKSEPSPEERKIVRKEATNSSRPVPATSQSSHENQPADISGGSVPVPRAERSLSSAERASLESACSHAKYIEGPAAYNQCVESQLGLLAAAPPHPDLSSLTGSEKQSIESACSKAKYLEGPAAYNRCLQSQLASLASAPRRPDLSRLSHSEEQSIESACSHAKYLEGPAAYNRCLVHQLELLGNHRP